VNGKTLTEAEARQLANAIKTNLIDLEKNLRLFHAVQGWFPLGYDSFTTWWDNEMREIPIATGIRNWAIFAMIEENTDAFNRIRSGMVPVIAHATGLAPTTISGIKSRARPKVRKFSRVDEDPTVVSVVIPTRWHRHLVALSIRRDKPMSDFLRPIIKEGMMQTYGIDLDKPPFKE